MNAMRTESSKRKHSAGFSLVELLVVIGIIGILASIMLSAVGPVREKAKIAKAQAEVRELREAIESLRDDTGEWPGHKTVDDIECAGGAESENNELWDLSERAAEEDREGGLVVNDPDVPFQNWNGPYIGDVPKDPWGNDYFFDTDYYVYEVSLDIDGDGELDSGERAGADCVVVIGSFGSNGRGQNVYDGDDIIQVLTWGE